MSDWGVRFLRGFLCHLSLFSSPLFHGPTIFVFGACEAVCCIDAEGLVGSFGSFHFFHSQLCKLFNHLLYFHLRLSPFLGLFVLLSSHQDRERDWRLLRFQERYSILFYFCHEDGFDAGVRRDVLCYKALDKLGFTDLPKLYRAKCM